MASRKNAWKKSAAPSGNSLANIGLVRKGKMQVIWRLLFDRVPQFVHQLFYKVTGRVLVKKIDNTNGQIVGFYWSRWPR
jgi:hypothetical protein